MAIAFISFTIHIEIGIKIVVLTGEASCKSTQIRSDAKIKAPPDESRIETHQILFKLTTFFDAFSVRYSASILSK